MVEDPVAGSLIPVLAMLSYELIRWMGDHQENKLVKIMVAPNLALQKLTTREPDAMMVGSGYLVI